MHARGGFSPKVKPENLTLIGIRDVVSEERRLIRDVGITAYTALDVERFGIAAHMLRRCGAHGRTGGRTVDFL